MAWTSARGAPGGRSRRQRAYLGLGSNSFDNPEFTAEHRASLRQGEPMPDDTIRPVDAAAIAPVGAHFLFLSHAGVDSEAALRLARRLEESEEAKAHGLKVWIDQPDL